MIKSMLETDLYKLTMMQAVFHQFPSVSVKYEFKCRNKGLSKPDFRPFMQYLESEIDFVRQLTFTSQELSYLKSLPFFKQDFIDYLFGYRNNHNNVKVYLNGDGELNIDVTGTWLNTVLLEVPILAAVNEVYFTVGKNLEEINKLRNEGANRLSNKISELKKYNILGGRPLKIVEFGTRRRFSGEWQRQVVETLKNEVPQNLIGTSNVLLAKELGLKPVGTHAHEWFMAHQALFRIEDSQKAALQNWANEYRGQLAIALSDTLGINAFLKDFDLYFAKLYDGVRQDSGDPMEIYNKVINHYKNLGIDSKTKTIIFSDGLDISRAIEINRNTPEINSLFGIGTSLTNDMGPEPLQIVMKMVECEGRPVAKISEARGKTMCKNPVYLEYLKQVFGIE